MQRYLKFQIELLRLPVPVWRQVLLPKSATFFDLHRAIQDLGWEDRHLWQFSTRRREVITELPTPESPPCVSAEDLGLADYFPRKGSRLFYTYDFGDSWLHMIHSLGKVDHPESDRRILLDGAGAFPPEDSGGPWAIEDELAARKLEDEEEKEEDWIPSRLSDWDPEHFDLAAEKLKFDREIDPKGA